MTYGLQIAASGLMTALYRQDVLAGNLANINTAGFKPDVASTRPRLAVRQEDSLPFLPSNRLLEKLGGGALLNANRISFAQGALHETGNPLDVAVEGQGFMVVQDPSDVTGNTLRLTRDGRFTRNAEGKLVLASSGALVMDDSTRPITIPDGPRVQITGDGTIRQGGAAIGKLRVAGIDDTSRLGKVGHSMFSAPADVIVNAPAASGTVHQGAYEDSGVDEVRTIMQMTSVSREIDNDISLLQQQDRLMDRAINTFGRVA